LAQREATVVIVSHEEDRLARVEQEPRVISPKRSLVCVCDVRSQEDVDRMAATVRDRIGGVDVLISSAGFATYCTFPDSDRAELAR
jgi:NAD(P)-dependent dehydrogenase (short-subunit alcohol dehydrogenase family)